MCELFDELVNEKSIITARTKNGTGYRTDIKITA
jgi:hypothetical protein